MREGSFFGWPWYYIGANEDPHHRGERPDLKDKVTLPDVLIEAHSASLGMTIYDGSQFPAAYRGNIFAAEHGSWNRTKRTGYKVIRAIMKDGAPTGRPHTVRSLMTKPVTKSSYSPVGAPSSMITRMTL